MEDDAFVVAVRRRLLYSDPAAAAQQACQHQRSGGERGACGAIMGHDLGAHAICCPIGPSRVQRHNGVRDVLADWLVEQHGRDAVAVEQRIPAWDRNTTEGLQLAVLDIVVTRPTGKEAVDVSVTDASGEVGAAERRARRPGAAARVREQEKHRRYPGRGLVAAVLETGGRAGRELHAFLRSHATQDPAQRSAQLADIRQRLAVVLQQGNAAQMLSAAGSALRPWRSALQGMGGSSRARRGVRR